MVTVVILSYLHREAVAELRSVSEGHPLPIYKFSLGYASCQLREKVAWVTFSQGGRN